MKTLPATVDLDRLFREGRAHENRPAAVPVVPIEERISEKDFQQAIIDVAKRNGWKCYHTYDSRKSDEGWPDLFLCRGLKALALETKVDDNQPTAAQSGWLEALAAAGIEARTVWPRDFADIVRLLAAPPHVDQPPIQNTRIGINWHEVK